MKAIRRSLKGDKDQHKQHHVSITPKSAIAILPPKKVIKALYDYTPEGGTQELAFSKGDFFHVISREDDQDWYEACNPLIPSARGLVPVSFFEVIGKTERDSGGSGDLSNHDSASPDRFPASPAPNKNSIFRMSALKGQGAMVYGIVQYDFQAERPDELSAKAGEAIIVIAQSNPEWFVAKPIGRLGGPGLIPVSFLELRDMQSGQAVSDPLGAVRRAGVPKVEEWKKMTAEYKNSSISLGKIETGSSSGGSQMPVNSGMSHMSLGGHQSQQTLHDNYDHQRSASRGTQSQAPMEQPQGAPPHISAFISDCCFHPDEYWYIMNVIMVDEAGYESYWEFPRYYIEFYQLQTALLEMFPDAAGNGKGERIIPFLPGPLSDVTDRTALERHPLLDKYIQGILELENEISNCSLVREFLTPNVRHDALDAIEIDPRRFQTEVDAFHRKQEIPRHTKDDNLHQYSLYPSNSRTRHTKDDNPNQYSAQQQHTKPASSAMKVKVYFQDDLIAIRIPTGVTMQQLQDKLCERLKINQEIRVQYRNESGAYVTIQTDQDLDYAMKEATKLETTKLTLLVEIA